MKKIAVALKVRAQFNYPKKEGELLKWPLKEMCNQNSSSDKQKLNLED